MRAYNPKDWFRLIFRPYQSKSFGQMSKFLIVIGIYTLVVVYLEKEVLKLSETHILKNTLILQSLLGFAISILLVFRTNTAYERWWEGRKLWGSLVNSSRNLAIKLHAYFPEEKEIRTFYNRSISFFAKQLMYHLLKEKTRLMLDEIPHPELDLDASKHVPMQIAKLIFQKSHQLQVRGKLTEFQLLQINQELTNFMDVCGACERIKNTPIPYSYSAFIKKVVFLYVFSLPFGLSFSLGFLAIPIVLLVFYTMIGLELVAEEIEDPFSGDENDIPMDKISDSISVQVNDILG